MPDPSRVIAFHGLQLLCPFSSHFRRHTEKELAVMEDTIREYGIREPIRIYTDTTLNRENCIADGEGRLGLAVKLGLAFEDVKFEDFGEMTTQEAYEGIALVHNDGRRQDSADEVERRRIEREERHARIHRVMRAREEGKSIRVIAEEIGVSKSQVERDLADAESTVPGGTVATPERIVGKDGKERPAVMPPKPPPVPPPPSPPAPTYHVVDHTPAKPDPTPIPKAAKRIEVDWQPMENHLADLRSELNNVMARIKMTGSYEHTNAAALLTDFEDVILSNKKSLLSVRWRHEHANG